MLVLQTVVVLSNVVRACL